MEAGAGVAEAEAVVCGMWERVHWMILIRLPEVGVLKAGMPLLKMGDRAMGKGTCPH